MAPNAPVIDVAVIEQVYTNVRRIHREGHLRLAVAVGAQVVQKLLGGDIERWNEHGRAEPALKQLAQRLAEDPLEVMSPTTLYRCIAVYELNERVGVLGRPHLTFTHAVAVLGLPGNVQAELLQEAESDKWPTRRLLDEAKMLRAANRDPSDREPPSPLSRATQQLLKVLADPAFDELDVDADAAARIEEAIKRLQKIHEALTGRPASTGSPASTSPSPASPPESPVREVAEAPAPAASSAQPSAAAPAPASPAAPPPIDRTLTRLERAQAAALAYAATLAVHPASTDGDPASAAHGRLDPGRRGSIP